MLHQSAIEGYFAQQEDLLVEAVSRLVRIESTLGPAQPGQLVPQSLRRCCVGAVRGAVEG